LKLPAKLVLTGLLMLILTATGALGWFFFYNGDLPEVGLLTPFAPNTAGVANDSCLSHPIA